GRRGAANARPLDRRAGRVCFGAGAGDALRFKGSGHSAAGHFRLVGRSADQGRHAGRHGDPGDSLHKAITSGKYGDAPRSLKAINTTLEEVWAARVPAMAEKRAEAERKALDALVGAVRLANERRASLDRESEALFAEIKGDKQAHDHRRRTHGAA